MWQWRSLCKAASRSLCGCMQGAVTLMIFLTDMTFVLVVLRVRRLLRRQPVAVGPPAAQRALPMKQASYAKHVKTATQSGTKASRSLPAVAPARGVREVTPTASDGAVPEAVAEGTEANTHRSSSTLGLQVGGVGRQGAGALAEGVEGSTGDAAEVTVDGVAHISQRVVTNEAYSSPQAADVQADAVRESL